MGLGFLGGPEIMVIGVVLVVLFGGSRIGELGKGIGTFFKEVKKGVSGREDKDAE